MLSCGGGYSSLFLPHSLLQVPNLLLQQQQQITCAPAHYYTDNSIRTETKRVRKNDSKSPLSLFKTNYLSLSLVLAAPLLPPTLRTDTFLFCTERVQFSVWYVVVSSSVHVISPLVIFRPKLVFLL